MTGKKIKIALCLSGEPRSSMFCFPYIYETFLKPNDFFETDVYLYSFKGFRAVPLYNPKDIIINNDNETEIFKSWFNQKNQFDKEVRDKFKNSTDPVSLHSDPLKNLFLMFYGINNCMNLIKTPSKYQIFIRCRFDIIFETPFLINNIITDIIEGKYDIFTPTSFKSFYSPNLKAVNDQMAIMNHKAASFYKNTILDLTHLINQTKNVVAEEILFYQLQNNNIKTHTRDLNVKLIRNTFINSHPPALNFLDQ